MIGISVIVIRDSESMIVNDDRDITTCSAAGIVFISILFQPFKLVHPVPVLRHWLQ